MVKKHSLRASAPVPKKARQAPKEDSRQTSNESSPLAESGSASPSGSSSHDSQDDNQVSESEVSHSGSDVEQSELSSSEDADAPDMSSDMSDSDLDDSDTGDSLTKQTKPKKVRHPTLKPNTQEAFGGELRHLLALPETRSLPRPFPGASGEGARERKKVETTQKVARESRARYLARGHVDVISGWTAQPPIPFKYWGTPTADKVPMHSSQWNDDERAIREGGAAKEKQLKRLAQQGVVRLFNAISAAQGVSEDVAQKTEVRKLPPSAGPADESKNILGTQGKSQALANLSKSTFMDLVRGKAK